MTGSGWGGSEELWSQAAIELKRAGHDVHVSVAYWMGESDKGKRLERQGIELELQYPRFETGRNRRIWNALSFRNRRSLQRLKRYNPDLVIISQGHNAGGFDWAKVCRESGIPYVIIVQCNSDIWWFGDQVDDAVASYSAARTVFCVSQGNLDLLRLQLGEPLRNAEIVRNPFNVTAEPAPPWPDESRVWRLACVARLNPAAKGQDLLLQTLAGLQWRDRPVELNLFGDGSDELTLHRMVKQLKLDNINFRGHVTDVRAIWEHNHLLVLPSRYEGLPLALVEAMWCARPAVVTDVGGNAELCLDGETGFVAPAPTMLSLSQTLQRAWDRRHQWQHLGKTARIVVESKIPRDPVTVFCARLRACASAKSADMHVGEAMFVDH